MCVLAARSHSLATLFSHDIALCDELTNLLAICCLAEANLRHFVKDSVSVGGQLSPSYPATIHKAHSDDACIIYEQRRCVYLAKKKKKISSISSSKWFAHKEKSPNEIN